MKQSELRSYSWAWQPQIIARRIVKLTAERDGTDNHKRRRELALIIERWQRRLIEANKEIHNEAQN